MRAYESLVAQFEKINHFEGARAVLHWDGAAMMPSGGADARAAQVSALSVLIHQMTCDPKVADWLHLAEAEVAIAASSREPQALGWAQANLRELRRAVRHASAVPDQLVQALSEAGSRCEMVWREARADDDFNRLKPYLEEVLKLTREVATIKSEALGVTPYEALLDQYEPGASESSVDAAFAQLSLSLPQLIEEALDAQERRNVAHPIAPLVGPFSTESQRALGIKVMSLLGFDFNHGRLDVSHHPFCGGVPSDVRLTTRYNEQQFTQSLMGVIHETGHALYEQGLPRDWVSQPVGRARGMSVHESQSLFWEMQVGRSEAFISVLAPLVAEAFGGDQLHPSWSVEGLRREYTKVERSLIRVDADEVTYPAHVILRYDLERQLLGGDLEIADLPDAWNASMERLVGIKPTTNRDGCMQDIHWMDGAFGYFPTYTLGAMTAAQLFESVKGAIPDVHEQIRGGELSEVLSWLRENVHEQGSRWSTDELLTHATGRPLEVAPFLKHLRHRYVDEVMIGLSKAPAPFHLDEGDVELSEAGVIFTQEFANDALELVSEIEASASSEALYDLPPETVDLATQIGEVASVHTESDSLDEASKDILDLSDLQEMERELDGMEPTFAQPSQDFSDMDGLDGFESIDGLDDLDSIDEFDSIDEIDSRSSQELSVPPLPTALSSEIDHDLISDLGYEDSAFEEASTVSLIEHLNTIAAPHIAPVSEDPLEESTPHRSSTPKSDGETESNVSLEADDSFDIFELEDELRLAAELSEALEDLERDEGQEPAPPVLQQTNTPEEVVSQDVVSQDVVSQDVVSQDVVSQEVVSQEVVSATDSDDILTPLDLDLGVDPGPSAYETPAPESLPIEGLELIADDMFDIEPAQSPDSETMIGYAKEAIELMDSYQPVPDSERSQRRPFKDRVRSIIEKTRGAAEIKPPADDDSAHNLSAELTERSARGEAQAARDDQPSLVNPQQLSEPRADDQLAEIGEGDPSIANQAQKVDHSAGEGEGESAHQQIFKLR